jgi:hypothetical protein
MEKVMLEYDIEFLERKVREICEKIGLTYEEVIEELRRRIEYRDKIK